MNDILEEVTMERGVNVDGVPYIAKLFRGICLRKVYLFKCDKCGAEIQKTSYQRNRTYTCNYCRRKNLKKKKLYEQPWDSIKTPADERFDKAIERIRDQVNDFGGYKKSISMAQKRCEKYGSVPEAMVAIELLKLGYRIIPQQKVGRYRVDFALPDEKIIVEVDGKIYHQNGYNGKREAVIQYSMGMDWKIIHIPAEKIDKNIQKLKEIMDAFIKNMETEYK